MTDPAPAVHDDAIASSSCLHCRILKTIIDFFPGGALDANVVLSALCDVTAESLTWPRDRALSDQAMKVLFTRIEGRRDMIFSLAETANGRRMH